jgi:hypothetical protein
VDVPVINQTREDVDSFIDFTPLPALTDWMHLPGQLCQRIQFSGKRTPVAMARMLQPGASFGVVVDTIQVQSL